MSKEISSTNLEDAGQSSPFTAGQNAAEEEKIVEQFVLEPRKHDYVKRVMGHRVIAGEVELILSQFIEGKWEKHFLTINVKMLPNGFYEVSDNSWKNKYFAYYEVRNGKAVKTTRENIVAAVPKIPLKLKMIKKQDRIEYQFEYNHTVKEFLKAQGAKWDMDKKVWYSEFPLQLPEGDIEVEEVVET